METELRKKVLEDGVTCDTYGLPHIPREDQPNTCRTCGWWVEVGEKLNP